MAGRPPKQLTPEMIITVRRVLSSHGTCKMAAQSIGVSPALFWEWIARGRNGDAPFTDLVEAIKGGEEEATSRALDTIMKAISGGDVATAQWYLERKFPSDFGKRAPLHVETPDERFERETAAELKDTEAKVEELMTVSIARGDIAKAKDALEMLKTLNPSKWNAPPAPPADADPTVLQVPTPSPEF